jgi:glucoamylase
MPEQVWDSAPVAARGLEPGRPSGSAMPLLWTHAEFLKLLVARDTGKPVELLQVVEERYGAKPPAAKTWHWRAEAAFARLARGRGLVVEHRAPFVLHYGFNGWQLLDDRIARLGPFGIWSVTLTPAELEPNTEVNFTRRFEGRWEGTDYRITLGHAQVVHALTHQA